MDKYLKDKQENEEENEGEYDEDGDDDEGGEENEETCEVHVEEQGHKAEVIEAYLDSYLVVLVLDDYNFPRFYFFHYHKLHLKLYIHLLK